MTPDHLSQPSSDPLARRVLDRIEHEHLSPRPRWAFLFENWLFWTLGGVAVAFGALAFSAALFEVENAGWSLYAATDSDFLSFFFRVAPFLWVVALALFIVLGYENIRRTKRGYRYPLALIGIGAVLTSIALGSALYALGAGQSIEEGIGDHPPFYRPIGIEERAWWAAPERGVLGGEVLSYVQGEASFTLKDFSGAVWTIETEDLRAPDSAQLIVGNTVRVVGPPLSATSSAFHACFVFPWQGAKNMRVTPSPTASMSERNASLERSDICKGIRPYGALHALHGE